VCNGKMKHSIKLTILISTLSLVGCFAWFDSGSDRITGKFKVLWIDLPVKQHIAEESELHSSNSSEFVPPYVFAVGHDERYIIAKQHPLIEEKRNRYEIDTSITNYYVISIDRLSSMVAMISTLEGPMTKSEFDNYREKLEITSIEFDMLYPENF
jgi:hypothetical protein